MIYTVTFNPAIDYIVEIDQLALGQTNRSFNEEIQFGGKGINVSYVLSQLGIESVALGFVAGFTGDELQRLALKEGVTTDFIRLQNGSTRINIKLKGQQETEINACGPEISQKHVNLLFKKLDQLKKDDVLVLSGSVPPSVPNDIYERIMQRLQSKDVRFVVDAAGQLLINSLRYKPFLVKPNRSELQEISESRLETEDDIVKAALSLKGKGAMNVLVSLGADGAILVDSCGNSYKMPSYSIKPVNTVGAGDSMVAGFLAGVSNGFEYALQLGVAAGCATAASDKLATKEQILELLG